MKITKEMTYETITPEIAAKWVENVHPEQRKLRRDTRVVDLALIMEKGQWGLSSDAIVLDEQGRVINGQHRLHAVVLVGKPIQGFVLRTNDPDIFHRIDKVMPRTNADAIKGTYAADIAAAVRKIIIYKKINKNIHDPFNASNSRRLLTDQDILDFAEKHREKLEMVAAFVATVTKSGRVLARSFACMFCFLAMEQYPAEYVFEFMRQLYDGDSQGAAFDVRKRLIGAVLNGTKLHPSFAMALVIKAFNAHAYGRRPGVYRFVEQEAFPRIVPPPTKAELDAVSEDAELTVEPS